MVRRFRIVVVLSIAAFSCASRTPTSRAPIPSAAAPSSSAAPGIEEGSTAEAAVLVDASSEQAGIAWENDWIFRHYGRFRKKNVALATQGGRRFDVITVELPDHSEKILYFDITNFFGK